MTISYPYIPPDRVILYVGSDNKFMVKAMEFARENNTVKHIGAAVVVKNGEVVGRGSIGAGIHGEQGECVRERLGVATGTHYELCKGCAYEYHSEASAIRDAKTRGNDPRDTDLYLWGHWWCCEPCWRTMIEAGIRQVYLLEGSERLFNKNDPENIIGRQFS